MPLFKNPIPPALHYPVERFVFEVTASTNAFAAEWIRLAQSASEAVILAGSQTAGRGQLGRAWSTEPGKDLAWTYARRFGTPVNWNAEDLVQLNMHWAASATNCVMDWAKTPIEVGVKWPNDLYAKSPELGWRKLGGMLIEAHWRGDGCLGIAFGIGINVQSSRAHGMDHAISLLELGCSGADVGTLAQALEHAVREAWNRPFNRSDYNQHLLFKGETRMFEVNGKSRQGVFLDALPNGLGRFLWESGERDHAQGEVKWCWDQG